MHNKQFKQHLAVTALCITTLCTAACGTQTAPTATPSETITTQSSVSETELKSFTFTVVDGDGNETVFDIETNEETVGAALLEEGLIAGENGQYGLYVKTVNGILADYETTGTYWAFYINDEYGSTGVDTTPITEGESYAFKVE